MNELDFRKAKKQIMTVTLLNDEKVLIRKPTKKIMDYLIGLSGQFEKLNEEDAGQETLECIYDVCAEIMSNNRQGKTIQTEELSELLDIEDLIEFFQTYMEFINDVQTIKN